jgi:hypothetical protein
MRIAYLMAAVAVTASVPILAASGQPDSRAKMICKYAKVTGSRLGKERICMPRSDWDILDEENRKSNEKTTTPGPGAPPT